MSGEDLPKVGVMLAGPGADVVLNSMQPPFLLDARFAVRAVATSFEELQVKLPQMRPEVLVIQADMAPGPDSLIEILSKMQVWNGVAIVILCPAWREFLGALEKVATTGKVFLDPVNWAEMAHAAYDAAITQRARLAAAAPLQQAYFSRAAGAITGTRVVAFLSACSGAGRSTVAENLAYELAVRCNAKTLLASFDLPPSAVSHLKLHYEPSAQAFLARASEGLGGCLQMREGLEVLVAPENTSDYLKAARVSENDMNAPNSIYSLVMATWTRNCAAILLDLPGEEGAWTLQPLSAANSVVLVARPTLADMAATTHTLLLLLQRLATRLRAPREAIYLVLNQVGEKSGMTPHGWHENLARAVPWAPSVAAVIPFDPGVVAAQDRQVPPVTCVDGFARGIRMLVNALFPGLALEAEKERRSTVFRMPGIRVRIGKE
ncbi:MAG: hypothetical protein ABSB61_07750 [Anaerolineales bacterium]|jgi:Flp pilus assembly CpaE family ATPase